MGWFRLLAAASGLVSLAAAKELPWDEARSIAEYQNGAKMQLIKNQKEVRDVNVSMILQ